MHTTQVIVYAQRISGNALAWSGMPRENNRGDFIKKPQPSRPRPIPHIIRRCAA
jgi:hypothetical protein